MLFGKLKWFPEDVADEAPILLESKEIAREMGPQAIPFLTAKLKNPATETDNSVDQRRKAAWALGQLGPAGKEAVPALIQALQDQGDRVPLPDGHRVIQERVCTVAATALGEIGPAAKEAIPALNESLHYGVGSALPALARIAPESPQTLAALTEALQDYSQGDRSPELAYRFEALRGLALLAEVQAEALSWIGIALKDPELRPEATRVLLASKRFPEAAAASLDRAWKEGSIADRSEAAAALSQNGRRSPELLAVMLQRLQQREGGLSAQFLQGLWAYHAEAKPAIPYLLQALGRAYPPQAWGRAKNAVSAQALVGALAEIGKGDEELGRWLEPCLLEAIHDPDRGTRSIALTALGKVRVNPKKGIPALLEALDDPSPGTRSAALMGLAEYGAAAKETVPRIVALLEAKNHGTAMMAAAALGDLGTNAASAIPALVKALDSPEDDLRHNAANALGKFGPAARPAIPALEKLLRHSSGMEQENAAVSLWRLDGRTDVVPILIDSLKSQGTWDPLERQNPNGVRSFAVSQLGEIGPPAKAAVPLLQQMLQTADPNLRAIIQRALTRITAPPKPAADR